MIKLDLHTHSTASPDGGITAEEYSELLENGELGCIAVTDHNTIENALALYHRFPAKVIVGEEIDTLEGEIIGLFLIERIAPRQTARATTKAIKKQGGLVYIPHPFETVRSGLTHSALDSIAEDVDIVEIHNGRAVFQNKGAEAATWARLNRKVAAASSDAHGRRGLLTTFTTVHEQPTKENLLAQLTHARYTINRPPLSSLLYPKYHRFRKRLGSTS